MLDRESPRFTQSLAVCWGVFFGYPVTAIQAFIDHAAHKRGWLQLEKHEVPVPYVGTSFIPCVDLKHVTPEELERILNRNRFAPWKFEIKPRTFKSVPEQEQVFYHAMRTNPAFVRACEQTISNIKLYSA